MNWYMFTGTNRHAGMHAAVSLASNDSTFLWYVGVTGSPIKRMVDGDTANPTMVPHKCRGYDCMYPLVCSRNAGEIEKLWIEHLTSKFGWRRRGNKGSGGEHVRVGAMKFMYVCFRWQKQQAQRMKSDEESGEP